MSFNYQGAPGIYNADPTYTQHPRSAWSSFVQATLATALFRCWHILIFFGAWSTAICLISYNVHNLALQPTLITVYASALIMRRNDWLKDFFQLRNCPWFRHFVQDNLQL